MPFPEDYEDELKKIYPTVKISHDGQNKILRFEGD